MMVVQDCQDIRKDVVGAADERTSLLRRHHRSAQQQRSRETYTTLNPEESVEDVDEVQDELNNIRPVAGTTIRSVFPVLLLGVSLANGDGSIVLATNQHIASEFNALSSAAWLIMSYTLAQCSSQPLYGKISNIFGRQKCLAFCWTTFALGCLIIGISRAYWQVLLGRAISGIGGAGMVALTSIVVTDLLPPKDVAQYRSYISLTATTARSIGGPVGAWMAGSFSWRWCFVWQCPIALCGLLLVLWRLAANDKARRTSSDGELCVRSKLARVDFLGAFTLVGTVLTCLLSLDLGTKGLPWRYLGPLIAAFVVFAISFVIVEKRFAREPVLPVDLISKRDVFIPYLIIMSQAAGQFGLLYGIPLYFQVANGESVSQAGVRIVPVVIGNATGSLIGGKVIGKTKRYKYLTVFGLCCSITCFSLMCLRWHGSAYWAENFYVYLAGFGMGTSQSTTFVHLAASLDHSEIAIAGASWFLAQSFGSLIGASIGLALINSVLGSNLERLLEGVENKAAIIKIVTSSVKSIHSLPNDIRTIVTKSYIISLLCSDGLSLLFVCCSLMITLSLKERSL